MIEGEGEGNREDDAGKVRVGKREKRWIDRRKRRDVRKRTWRKGEKGEEMYTRECDRREAKGKKNRKRRQ